jgi:putative FmdB family regulatory protein
MLENMDLGCIMCGHKYTDLIDRVHRDEWFTCPACGEQSLRRMLSAPNIRTSDSATFLDGTRKFTGLREQTALKKEARAQVSAEKKAKLTLHKEPK